MIPQKNISIIANKLFEVNDKKGRRIPDGLIEKDYCLTWFLIGLSKSSLKGVLVFKGGTCLRRCYFRDYRFSEDLDFTLIKDIARDEIIEKLKKEVFPRVQKESGVILDINNIEEDTQNTHQFYVSFIGPLPKTTDPKTIKVDITFKETLVTAPIQSLIFKSYDEFEDIEEKYSILTYTVDEIMTEKICALIDPARTEPRDLYDVWHLFNEKNINRDFLPDYVIKKLLFKGVDFEKRKNNLKGKGARFKKSWEQRLSQQISNLPEFESVFRDVLSDFRDCKISD